MKNKIKILQIGKYFPPDWGGIETVCYELNEGINKDLFIMDILCFSKKKDSSIDNDRGYKVYRSSCLGVFYSQPISLKYISFFKSIRNEYDILHVHMPNILAMFLLIFFKTKGKIIFHWHSDIIKQRAVIYFYDFLMKMLSKKIDLVLSPTLNHVIHSRYSNLFKDKYKIIPFFMSKKMLEITDDEYKLSSELFKKYNNKKIIFSVGRLVYYKGFKYLIDSAKYLSDDYLIIIASSGPLENELRNQISKMDLTNKVILLGRISDSELKAYYHITHIFCLPSVSKAEMFGMVQLEAMFYGKPIISTEITGSGVSLVNVDNVSGLIIPIEDSKAIYDAVVKISEDDSIYKSMCENGRKRFMDVFETDVVMKEYEKMYMDILNS